MEMKYSFQHLIFDAPVGKSEHEVAVKGRSRHPNSERRVYCTERWQQVDRIYLKP
jgi:hypothetical protein